MEEQVVEKAARLSKKEKKEQKYQRLKEKYKQKKTKRTRRKRAPEDQEISNYRVCIEVLGGRDLMSEKEMRSLCEQIRYVYAANRVAQKPVQLMVSNASLLEGYARNDVANWTNIEFKNESVAEMKTEDIVILSADSPNTISEMKEGTVYVIGGLVDRNRHKGYLENLFKDKFTTAKLPITQKLSCSKVLSTLHVFSILQTYTETKDWDLSLKMHLPERKQVSSEGQENSKSAEKKEEECEGVSIEHGNSEENIKIKDGKSADSEEKPQCTRG
ncbi:tRNA (guanine9-N1)-methyltransferase [Nematocida minor]|uniref:tRNA (guanine9-N1)-methyltransferase n=1 Tax=Nematocida minor TaxID=1912983 RepID=UPI00221EE69D|nr:tRNA (guanine9-N1)-methyltransferase [Nematocida minor]KAI5191117.1 tRNA (guanine9-N1)-methyltransferase [Nematocida minor]